MSIWGFLVEYPSLITWVLIIGTTIWAHYWNNIRTNRNELRSLCDKVIQATYKIRKDANNYYRENGNNADIKKLAAEIKGDLQYINEAINSLTENKNILEKYEEFFDVVSGKHFEETNRLALDETDELFGMIHDSTIRFVQSMESYFKSKYK